MKAKHDKYYTPEGTIKLCVDFMKRHIHEQIQICIEPCAGDGRWLQYLSQIGNRVDLYDLEPDEECGIPIKQMDFLTGQLEDHKSDCTVIVTNPPFGKSNSLSNKIFNRAAEYEPEYICFLVPVSFGVKKADNLSHEYTLIASMPIPQNHFERPDGLVYEGSESALRCNFQIWKKQKRQPRVKIKGHKGLDGVTEYRRESFTLYRPENHKEDGKEQPVGERGRLDGKNITFTIITHGTKAGMVKPFEPEKDKVSVRQFISAQDPDLFHKISPELFREALDTSAFEYNPSLNSEEIVRGIEKMLAEEKQKA